MATLMIRADLPTIDAIDAAVTTRADTLTETMPDANDDQRRVHAMLLLAHPGATPETPVSDLLPTVTLYLHSYASPDTDPDAEHGQIARLEGHGPVTEAWITRVLGPRARIKIQPVLDLAGQAPVDSYEIPDRHRQAVHLITPGRHLPPRLQPVSHQTGRPHRHPPPPRHRRSAARGLIQPVGVAASADLAGVEESPSWLSSTVPMTWRARRQRSHQRTSPRRAGTRMLPTTRRPRSRACK